MDIREAIEIVLFVIVFAYAIYILGNKNPLLHFHAIKTFFKALFWSIVLKQTKGMFRFAIEQTKFEIQWQKEFNN